MARKNTYTAAIIKLPNGVYSGQVIEYPSALSEGKTIKEVEQNLADAIKELIESNCIDFDRDIKRISKKYKVIRKTIKA